MLKSIAVFAFLILIAGCGDTSVVNIHLGSVSIGQQLMDLQSAKEAGVMTEAEYEAAKLGILAIATLHSQDEEQSESL